MLVTRHLDTSRNDWSSGRLNDVYHNAASPRVSSFESLSTHHPDWREQFSAFSLPGDNGFLQQSFEQSSGSDVTVDDQDSQQNMPQSPFGHRHSLGSVHQESQQESILDRAESASRNSNAQIQEPTRADSLLSTASKARSLEPLVLTPRISISSAPVSNAVTTKKEGDSHSDIKSEEDEDELEDDDMLDVEEGAAPQTAAERRAERRKMKRFRLTHQQTRFLMSEFAKQAHPDAAHRDRLSREIPGLSPRQVQVWFQNRRAKIKRLTVDDRERMMKMRAVPDDFDSIQALHSPYGAVHGGNTPLHSPMEFMPSYGDHMTRPHPSQRSDTDEQNMSTSCLSPAYSHVLFDSQRGMGSPGVLSPLSLNPSDRYFSNNHLSGPMNSGPRSSNPFERKNDYNTIQSSRQNARLLQPLQLRETLSRSKSESLSSPLRSSMSWKGETLDYGSYPTEPYSPPLSGGLPSVYQDDQIGHDSADVNHYENSNAYPATTLHSPPHISYPTSHGSPTPLQQSPPSHMSRLRTPSSGVPSGLDLRDQYRGLSPHANTARGSAFAGFASAPLTAPVDFSLPRTPMEANAHRRSQDYSIPQQSAPMVPPSDFANAYANSLLSPGSRTQHLANRQAQGPAQGEQSPQHQYSRSNEELSTYFPPTLGFEAGQNRQRSVSSSGAYEHS